VKTARGQGILQDRNIRVNYLNKELSQIIQTQPIADIGKHFRRARMLYLQEQALRK